MFARRFRSAEYRSMYTRIRPGARFFQRCLAKSRFPGNSISLDRITSDTARTLCNGAYEHAIFNPLCAVRAVQINRCRACSAAGRSDAELWTSRLGRSCAHPELDGSVASTACGVLRPDVVGGAVGDHLPAVRDGLVGSVVG